MPSYEEEVRNTLQVLQGLDQDFSVLSVHANKAFRFEKIDLELQKQVSGKIVDDIFRHVGLAKDDAPECWKKAHERLVKGKILETTMNTRITAYSGWKTIKEHSKRAMRLYQQTGKLPCLSAPVMISMIALLFYRKIRLDEVSMKNSSPNVLELFGAHDTTKWLRVAILTSDQTGHESFLVEVDHEMVAPQVHREHIGSDNFSIVTTAEPPTHQYRGLVNSRFQHTRIQLLSGSLERLPSEDRSHRESTASTDGDESPIEQVVTRSITRAQALERAGDLVNQVRDPGFDQFALKDQMGLWLSEPVIRVLPMDLKKKVSLYCSDHLPDLSDKIKEHYYDDRDEHTWQETIQVAPAQQVYGKETLGSLLAKLKTLETKIHPTELREAVSRLRRSIRPHGKYWDKMSQDMASVLKGSGTSTAEQRQTFAEEMSQQRQTLDEKRRDLDEKRSALAQQQETFAGEISQQRQTLDRDLAAFAQHRRALADTSDFEALWDWFLCAEVHIPQALRIVMQTRCSWDTLERLVEMENAQN